MTQTNRAQDMVVVERVFDAPIAVIWQMWTDPEHFAVWYGPNGASIVVAKMDVRVDGARLVGMTVETPTGPMQLWFAGEFLEVKANERLVYTEFISDENGNLASPPAAGMSEHTTPTEVRVDLTDVGGSTRMVMTHRGIPADSAGAAGWTMAFAKLVSHLDEIRTELG